MNNWCSVDLTGGNVSEKAPIIGITHFVQNSTGEPCWPPPFTQNYMLQQRERICKVDRVRIYRSGKRKECRSSQQRECSQPIQSFFDHSDSAENNNTVATVYDYLTARCLTSLLDSDHGDVRYLLYSSFLQVFSLNIATLPVDLHVDYSTMWKR